MIQQTPKHPFRIEWDLHELGPKRAETRAKGSEAETLRRAVAKALAAGDIAASNAEATREHAA